MPEVYTFKALWASEDAVIVTGVGLSADFRSMTFKAMLTGLEKVRTKARKDVMAGRSAHTTTQQWRGSAHTARDDNNGGVIGGGACEVEGVEVSMYACMHAYIQTCMHARIQTCIHTYIHAYIHIQHTTPNT